VSDFFRIDRVGNLAAIQQNVTNSLVVAEAEDYDDLKGRTNKKWLPSTDRLGFSGLGAMLAGPDTGALFDLGFWTQSPELKYTVNFTQAGTYYVWLRGLADKAGDASVHVGLDGGRGLLGSLLDRDSQAMALTPQQVGAWTWFNTTVSGAVAVLEVPSTGVHTISIWMREDGFRLDKLLLTTNSRFVPTGAGPDKNPRNAR
jgi:hypothetical protein